VEHNLAKVGVGSSSLLSRSKFKKAGSEMSRLFYCLAFVAVQLPTRVVSWGASPIGLLSRSKFKTLCTQVQGGFHFTRFSRLRLFALHIHVHVLRTRFARVKSFPTI
ncbi:hypothetical protein, partial [Thalassolituus sp. UBA3500]|uniref:hypothetical protein n=1 Tax=Thalassolituus sp. UBA3500 TaxID=1947664 RepID=UPI00263A7587